MGRSPIFLTANQIVRLYRTCIISSMSAQRSLLDSAVFSPINQHHYTSNDNIFYLAAVLAHKIALNHSFSDGNKRISVAAADMFLRLNGFHLTEDGEHQITKGDKVTDKNLSGSVSSSPLADAHVAVASGLWDEEDLAQFYQKVARPLDG